MTTTTSFSPIVCVVGFHHARGPEIENWFGVEDGLDPAVENDWSYLPFMALSDGAHASVEDFSYFTLRRRATSSSSPTSVFGISCTRQMDANDLLDRPADVTRSTVQKAVVAIAESPQSFGHLREKLSMVTGAWFAQRDFTDVDILKKFQESLLLSLQDREDDRDQYLGVSLREFIHEFKHQTLVLFKCCLLQPKMLFFGSRCERLCMMQFSLISLIPGLLRRLEDCADPEFDAYEKNLVAPTSLRTSERSSLLSYMGLPLQLFGKGALFGPYTPLQQLDVLADYGTKSYIVGSTNSLLLQQKDRYSDILINLDETTISITSTSLRSALALSAADRRWIDFLSQTVADTWDEAHPSRPRTMGYMGSEEFIRLQFEEYILALLSSVKYHIYLSSSPTPPTPLATIEGDPISDFNLDWIHAWKQTSSFALFNTHTDSHLFDIVEPRHPTAGNLSFEDIQRRLALQIQTLHLDDRLATSKEVLNRHLATGQKKVSTAFTNLWADIEALREAQQRKRAEAAAAAAALSHQTLPSTSSSLHSHRSTNSLDANFHNNTTTTTTTYANANANNHARRGGGVGGIDTAAAQASVAAAGQKAGAYLSSWGAWAADKRKGWGRMSSSGDLRSASASANFSGFVGGREKEKEREKVKERSWDGGSGLTKARKEELGADGIGRLDA